MSRLIISGASGRMGRTLAQMADGFGFTVVCGVDTAGQPPAAFPVYPSFDAELPPADVLIDFSLPGALPALAAFLLRRGMPAVLCATGYNAGEEQAVERLAQSIAVFRSANMSLGVYVLKKLAAEAKRLLPQFDIEIVEKHHNRKADAPSGTALQLLRAVAGADSVPVYGRTPESGRRGARDIGLHAVRGGTVAGEHEVGFYGESERLILSHSAESRAVFAAGALRAAQFLMRQPKGLYGMDEYFSSL